MRFQFKAKGTIDADDDRAAYRAIGERLIRQANDDLSGPDDWEGGFCLDVLPEDRS